MRQGIPGIPRVPADAYYARKGISPNDPFDLPDDIEASLASFDALDEDERARFDRACYWFQHAQETWSTSHSAAIIALVSAVEALGPAQHDRPRCETCGQIIGATKTFHSLVDNLVPGANAAKAEFYKARSNLSHGVGLRAKEIDGLWTSDHRGMGEIDQLYHLANVARLALHNWLVPEVRARAGA